MSFRIQEHRKRATARIAARLDAICSGLASRVIIGDEICLNAKKPLPRRGGRGDAR